MGSSSDYVDLLNSMLSLISSIGTSLTVSRLERLRSGDGFRLLDSDAFTFFLPFTAGFLYLDLF